MSDAGSRRWVRVEWATGPGAGAASAAPVGLRARAAWTLSGQSIYMLTQFAVLVLLARLASVEDMGRFGFATAIITPIYWLLDLGLRTNKTTDATDLNRFSDLLALRLITTAVGYGLILALAAVLAVDEATFAIMAVFGAAKGVETVSDIAYGMFQRRGHMPLFARSVVLRGLCGLAFFTVVLLWSGSVAAAFAGHLVAWAATCLAHDLPLARRLSQGEPRHVDWGGLWPMAVSSLSLGGSQFLGSLNMALPRLFIERFVGMEALGIYTAVSYVLQAANMTLTAVSRSIMGHLADMVLAGRLGFVRQVVLRWTGATFLCGILGLLLTWPFGDAALTLLFGSEFQGQGTLLSLIMAVAVLRGTGIMLQTAPLARRRFATLVRLRAVDVVVVAAASYVGAVVAGLEGIAVGLCVAGLLQLVLLFTVLMRIKRGSSVECATQPHESSSSSPAS